MHCGALGPKHGVIYGGPQYPDITCQRNGLSFNPAMSLDQMRAVHRLLQESLMRTGSAGYAVRDEQALFGEISYRLSDQWRSWQDYATPRVRSACSAALAAAGCR